MKKRTKKYMPRAIKPHSFLDAIHLSQPVSAHAKTTLDMGIRTALLAFTQGVATRQHYNTLASTIDLCLIASANLFHDAYQDELYAARSAMLRTSERFSRTNKLGFDGQGLAEIKQAIAIHNELLNNVTGAEVLSMMKARQSQCNSGHVGISA